MAPDVPCLAHVLARGSVYRSFGRSFVRSLISHTESVDGRLEAALEGQGAI